MKLLLDTHVLLWWFSDDPRLGPEARAFMAAAGTEVFVSCASFWEISIKHRIGKMSETGSVICAESKASGFTILGISEKHLTALEELPLDPDFKDPFDNLILAQSMSERAKLITSDRKLLKAAGHVLRAT